MEIFKKDTEEKPPARQLDIFTQSFENDPEWNDGQQSLGDAKKYPCKIEDYAYIYDSSKDPNAPQGFFDSLGVCAYPSKK